MWSQLYPSRGAVRRLRHRACAASAAAIGGVAAAPSVIASGVYARRGLTATRHHERESAALASFFALLG